MTDVIPLFNKGSPDGFCETPTAATIINAARYCLVNQRMGLIVGEPGIGKTTALRHFTQSTMGVHFVTINPTLRTLHAALSHIAQEIGCYPGGRARETYEILERGLGRRHGRLLILDEAQHLSDEALEALRCIHDGTQAGVLLCGNAFFRTRFNNERRGFGQITSRLGIRIVLEHPDAADVDSICAQREVHDPAARSFLVTQSRTVGALRLVDSLIDMATKLAGSAGAIRVKHLKDGLRMLGGEA